MWWHPVRLAFGLVWLALGVALLVREAALPEQWFQNQDPAFLNMAGLFALALAVFNLSRWYLARRNDRRTSEVPSPLERPPRERPDEYLPEFDFDRRPPAG